jgi:hypothetical protein
MSYTKDNSKLVIWRQEAGKYWNNPTLASQQRTLARTRTGESNPNWKTQVKNQQNATTGMTGVFETFQATRAFAETVYYNYGTTDPTNPIKSYVKGDIGQFDCLVDWLPIITTSTADNRALIAYLNHVRSARSSFSGPVFLGELRESLKMIRHPFVNLRNLADTWINKVAKAKRPRGPKGPVNPEWKKNLSGLWLEQAFGWQPLISDINSAFKTFRGLRDSKPQKPVSGFGIEEINVPAKSYTMLTNPGTFVYYDVDKRSKERAFVKYTGMVNCRTQGSPVDALEPFGFTIDSWAPTAWELLPWSFLIDYFTNAGDVISAGTVSRVGIAWTRKTTVTYQIVDVNAVCNTAKAKSSLDLFGTQYYISAEGSPTKGNWTRRVVTRLPEGFLGIPTLSLEIPGLPTQWANMTALFASANAVHPQRRRF